ncbi:ShlB/FhaC/HecB family hemolysin secretion/activation protein [Fusobacterium necrophorum]|uniref:Hemolysin activator protein n=2 Tax=Fusobacterium necrophorum TaxID=859 RepID=A0AB73C5I8_9FUSO|nr:ShlB/FhaC/HecB family hemolysin secretion/activation protein [Fusobacterium necrophorum]KDE73628.1 hemolysin activator protein [Fusobacterium necrophorum DJ-2]MBR8822972.1 Hemolysin transporter protein ShlB [Fusobacterium necrophorum]MCF0162497.1 ShlB/FhaC/HecB family hemolysin secretion/activation protein [Fusobacterium necrophorum]
MKRFVGLIFFVLSIFSFSIDEVEMEQRRKSQRDFEDFIKTQTTTGEKTKKIQSSKELVLNIKNVTLDGNTLLQNFQIHRILRKYIGENKNVYSLIKELEDTYIEKGYITTRVGLDLEKSDLESGNMSLFVLEGKIEKIFYDGEENITKTFITFPQRADKILNIRDLDQGMDNLTDHSTMDIKPASKEGYSNIFIKKKNKPFILFLNYNDLGQSGTGRHRLKYSLHLHNVIGMNETIDSSFQMKMQRQKKDRNAENFSVSTSIPFKNWSFHYAYDNSETFRTIYAHKRKYKATGRTINQNFEIRNVIYRNEDHKVDFGGKITLKDSKNYIDDIRLITGSRKLSVFTLNSSHTGRAFSGLIHSSLGVSFGLKKYGANQDAEEWYREDTTPKAQFRKYNLEVSWYKAIQKLYYKMNVGAQYSKDILYSQEKISIGDDTTVRGFQDESIQGDSGIYLRNEVGYKGLDIIEPFLAYDYGKIKNNKIREDRYEVVQGVAIGVKLSLKGFEGSIVTAKPIDRPEYFKHKKPVMYTSLSYRF